MSNPFDSPVLSDSSLPEQIASEMASPVLGRSPRISVSQHVLQLHNYKRPTFCAHCGGLLVGVVKQGLRCKRCEVDVHEKCQEDLTKPCIEVIVGHHNFREKSYKQLTYCDYCEKLLVGVVNQGLKCTECGTNVHEKCQEKIEVSCEKVKNRKSKQTTSIIRGKGSRRSVRREGGKKLNEKTPLKFGDAIQEEKKSGKEPQIDYSTMFETMPQPTSSKSTLNPSSLPGSPSRTPKQTRSHSVNYPGTDLQKKVGEVVSIMKDNADKMNERGEKLETLQDNAEELVERANIFQKKATDIKKKYWFKNKKLWFIIGGVILLIVIAIIIVAVVKTQKSTTTSSSVASSKAVTPSSG